MMASSDAVKDFFENIADSYGDKYSGGDAFHEYFFGERLDEATRGVDLAGKRVLDIGAGTGNLYDRLKAVDPSVDYYGTDISPAMLGQSNIPTDRRFAGRLEDIELPVAEFDLIFLLGVTSYLSDAEMDSIFDRVHQLLAASGKLIVTFTNASSLDWKTRSLFKSVARRLVPSRNVLAQSFPIVPRRKDDIVERLTGRFRVEATRYLNHTVFPINQLLKQPSARLARSIHPRLSGRKAELLSSDFMLVLGKA
jgi:SAM-dependent methyltransferase